MEEENSSYKVLIETAGTVSDDEDSGNTASDELSLIYILNAVLSGTARLNVLLPTATILAFTIFTPLLTNDGHCNGNLNRYLTAAFMCMCAISCVFFTVTDSFRSITGRLSYGIATFNGIWTFNRIKPMDQTMYKLRWSDVFHVLLSIVAFLTFAGLHHDVVGCYYPGVPRKVTDVVPLVVGFVVSVLFLLFPTKRKGIGYPFLLQREALYYRC